MKRFTLSIWALAAAVCAWGPAARAQERPVPATPPSGFECLAGQVPSIEAADAETAVELVCNELAAASGRIGRYRVSLRPLGRSLILDVKRLDAAGRVITTLDDIEEVSIAAPRAALAVVRNEPMSRSQQVDTLLETETRQGPLKEGKVSFGLGALGLVAPGQGVATGGGLSLSMSYSAPSFSVPVQFRVAGGGRGDRSGGANLVGFDVGMRWMASRRDISPFVGGGVGWLHWSVDDHPAEDYWTPTASYSGAAPFVEVGVEILRLHRARVSASLRTDFPLQDLVRPEGTRWDPATDRPTIIPARSFYSVPVTFGVSVAF